MASNLGGICSAGSSKATSVKAPMATSIGPDGRRPEVYRPFSELGKDRDDMIKALICRSWEARNPTGRYLGTEFIFSDEHGNAIHCIARSQIAHCVVPKLEIGQIYSIRGFTLEPNKPTYRVRRDERGRSIKVVLWGALAEDLKRRNSDSDELYVIVLPAMKVVEYRGGVQLSSTSGTCVFDNQAIPEISELRKLLGHGAVLPPENNGTLIQLLQLGREQHGQPNVASVAIKCQVSIAAIHSRSPWNYNSCGLKGCKKGVTPVGNQLWCESCGKPCEYPLLRYRLRLEVKDDMTSLVVTLFDDEAEAIMKKKATELMHAMEADANEADYPEELLELVGSNHLFELKSHTYYNHGRYESFTVSKVLSAPEKETVCNRVTKGIPKAEPVIGTELGASTQPGNMPTITNVPAKDGVQESENNSLPINTEANANGIFSPSVAIPAKTSTKRKASDDAGDDE